MSSDLSSTTRSPPSSSRSPSDDLRRPPPRGAEATEANGGGKQSRSRRQPWHLGLGATAWALDPRARWVREWNRAYLLACAAGLMVDPLFLYAVCVSGPLMCVFLDGWLAAVVTALRCAVDAMHSWNVATQLRVVAPAATKRDGDAAGADDDEERQAAASEEEDEEDQEGAEALRKLRAYALSKKGMVLDFFVILPVMQVQTTSSTLSITSHVSCFSCFKSCSTNSTLCNYVSRLKQNLNSV
jgi:cyclic nucleotide gated channel, plant